MCRFLSLIFCILSSGELFAQDKFFKELRYSESYAEIVDVTQLKDGTFLMLITREDFYSRPYGKATILLHTTEKGDYLAWLSISTPKLPVMYTNFITRNDSLLLEGLSAADSLPPYDSRESINITTYTISTDSLSIAPVNITKIETAFSVHTQTFKALNWTYFAAVGYDSEICRFDSDSGTGYKINVPGGATIQQLIETSDGGVIALGTSWPTGESFDANIYAVRLDRNLRPVWDKTYGRVQGPNDGLNTLSAEAFRKACLLPDSSLFILGDVTGYNNVTCYCLFKSNPRGDVLWERIVCDTVVRDSLYYYSRPADILPLSNGGCVITGYKKSQKDMKHTSAFVMFFDGAGNIASESSEGMEGTWVVPMKMVATEDKFYLFSYHSDVTRRSARSLIMSRLNRKGKFLPFRK